jgi:hypothetical protein
MPARQPAGSRRYELRRKKLSWFIAAKCPVDAETKEWIEDSFNWLIDELSAETLLANEVVLPTPAYFPDPITGKPRDVRRFLERVCGYMDIDPKEVELGVYSKALAEQAGRPVPEQTGHPQFLYKKQKGKYVLRLEAAQAAKAETLVAAIAHELGHTILIGENRLDRSRTDHEEMTDLLTVFYGFGVFSANAAFSLAQGRNAKYEGGPHLRAGYMTEEMYGYALALFVHARGESKPKWTSHLHVNVRHYFKQGLKFLTKTGDTTVKRLAAEES